MLWEVGGEIHQLSASIETPDRNSTVKQEKVRIFLLHTHIHYCSESTV